MESGNNCNIVAYTKVFLDSKVKEWEENKAYATKQLYRWLDFQ